jgi:hypothetical protein
MAASREFFRRAKESLRGAMHIFHEDKYDGKIKVKGEVFWTMTDVVTGEVTKGHIPNVVTLDASILLARLVKGTGVPIPHQSEPNFGVFALAVGTGDVAWNPLNPPPGTNTQRSLFNELARKAIASTDFIDGAGAISGVPTNVVDFTTTFATSEAVGPLTEMGLLGGDISTNMSITNPVLPPNGLYDPTVNVVGKDTLVNYITFPVISKPPTSTLSWTWRLTF